MEAEILIAWEDKTWTTEIFTVPKAKAATPDEAAQYVQNKCIHLTAYRKAVLFAPYCVPARPNEREMRR
jgi:hypothetical protein